jgi:hypothetical protein
MGKAKSEIVKDEQSKILNMWVLVKEKKGMIDNCIRIVG